MNEKRIKELIKKLKLMEKDIQKEVDKHLENNNIGPFSSFSSYFSSPSSSPSSPSPSSPSSSPSSFFSRLFSPKLKELKEVKVVPKPTSKETSKETYHLNKYLKYKERYTNLQSQLHGGSGRAQIYDSSIILKTNIEKIITTIKNTLRIKINDKKTYTQYEDLYIDIIILLGELPKIYKDVIDKYVIDKKLLKEIIEFFMILMQGRKIIFKKLKEKGNIDCDFPFFEDILEDITNLITDYDDLEDKNDISHISFLLRCYVWINKYIKDVEKIISFQESATQIFSLKNLYTQEEFINIKEIIKMKKDLKRIQTEIYKIIDEYFKKHNIIKDSPFYNIKLKQIIQSL